AQLPLTLVRSAPLSLRSTPEETAANPSRQPSPASEYEETAVTVGQPDVGEEELLALSTLDTSSKSAGAAAPKSDQQEANTKTTSSSIDSSLSRNASVPRAEDRFMTTVENDLNKATELPVELRRL